MVVPTAAAELAPGDSAGDLDGSVVRIHLRSLLPALQALRTVGTGSANETKSGEG